MLKPTELSADDIVAGVERALLTLGRQTSTRGVVVEHPGVVWSRLIVSPATAGGLEQVLCLARLGGARDNGHKGLRALFAGPSGTGKTLAARAIATTLGLPLYRVDLATVVSKWVGETEKNLRHALAAAEAAGAILFFDEGDALLSKRGDVARGTDRYANHEVSYLLQALESHDGTVIVATNLKHSLDPAFSRRFDVSVEFTLPAAPERRKLWVQELGEDAAQKLGAGVLDEIAVPELSGGNIAGAARLAVAICHGRGGETLSAADVRKAIAAEFYKIGSAVQGAQWTMRAERRDPNTS
jgi:SpoVK/Ycf46/Vps4 family AAA+-type ATPase